MFDWPDVLPNCDKHIVKIAAAGAFSANSHFVRRTDLAGTVRECPQQPMKTKVLALHSPPSVSESYPILELPNF